MVALTLAGLATGCGGSDADNDAAGADSANVAETPQVAAELMAPARAILVAMIDYTDEARQRAAGAEVRQYATVVSTDHRGTVQAIDDEAQELGARIEQTPAAQELENAARMAHAGLGGLEAGDYDLAFIRAQVEAHRQVLDRLEHESIPGATSPAMQQMLRDVQAAEAAHLARARQILASLLGESAEPEEGGPGTTVPDTVGAGVPGPE